MNAALLALLWSLYQDPTFRTGALPVLLSHVTNRSGALLLKNLTWRAILGSWTQPSRQHDIHELLLYIMPRISPPEFSGMWQTRRLEDTGIAVCGSAHTTLPITLDVPNEARGLQHCVQEWHSQHYHTAFTSECPTVCLHLSRYRHDAAGHPCKDNQPLPDWCDTLRLPLFRTPHTLEVSLTRSVPWRCTSVSNCIGGTIACSLDRGKMHGSLMTTVRLSLFRLPKHWHSRPTRIFFGADALRSCAHMEIDDSSCTLAVHAAIRGRATERGTKCAHPQRCRS